jgi:hypothetical protein
LIEKWDRLTQSDAGTRSLSCLVELRSQYMLGPGSRPGPVAEVVQKRSRPGMMTTSPILAVMTLWLLESAGRAMAAITTTQKVAVTSEVIPILSIESSPNGSPNLVSLILMASGHKVNAIRDELGHGRKSL